MTDVSDLLARIAELEAVNHAMHCALEKGGWRAEAVASYVSCHRRMVAATRELASHGLYFSWVTGHPDMVALCVKATGQFYKGEAVASPALKDTE